MSQRRSIFAVIGTAALGFALLAWVSTAGSLQMLQIPRSTASPGVKAPRPPAQAPSNDAGSQPPEPLPTGANAPDLTWVQVTLAVLLISAALLALAYLARWAWRQRRPHRQPHQTETPFEVLPEVALAALVADAPTTLATLELGSPRNAIVACWLRLEEAVGLAGFPRRPSETSTEFATRILGSLAVDATMFNGFARFYREARFSDHEMGEPARRAAIAALRSLYDDIADTGTPIPSTLRSEEVR